MTTPGLLIASPRSGSGKTTVTLGVLRALSRRGLAVGCAKCGPDYIDPAFHAAVTGRSSFNLDSWAMPEGLIGTLAARAGDGADLVVCEGLMGLFDGVPAEGGRTGSSADIAAAMGWPVILVHDVGGQAQSAAAQIAGCAGFDPRIRVAGVILNRVGSERHRRLVTDALAGIGATVLGALPRADHLKMAERHLGLVQAQETTDLAERVDAMGDLIEAHVDLDALVALAGARPTPFRSAGAALPPPGQRIALASDQVFSFLYPHILDGWRNGGAELVPFSPLNDEAPPEDCDCCWLPGGYPELHAARLAAASRFLSGLSQFAEAKPVHGECGGYMTLGETLTDAAGATHRMAGLLSVRTDFSRRKLHLGYRDAQTIAPSLFGPSGTRLRGHEFHYASVLDQGADLPFAEVKDAYGGAFTPTGSRRGHVTGSFFHCIAAESDT